MCIVNRKTTSSTVTRLTEDPGRILSTGQIGITLLSILAGGPAGSSSSPVPPDAACPQLWIIPLFLSALALGLAYWVLTS
jgi:CBS domain containing-hemolysin-like protein